MTTDAILDGTFQEIDPNGQNLQPGVSVVIPSFRGRKRIGACLNSLASQTLDSELFEVIIVLNGPSDGTRAVLERAITRYPDLDLKILEIAEVGAAHARNAGISAATRQHITFIDDDDTVSPAYLEILLAHARPGVVPFAQIVDISESGRVESATPINIQTIPYAGKTVHPVFVPRAVGFNACKLLPTEVVKKFSYDTSLTSGVDVVFFMTLLANYDFLLHVCPVENGPDAANAIYYRFRRPNSMSRRKPSFDFSVLGRLEVITRITSLMPLCDERRRRVLTSTISSQVGFINRYLAAYPDDLTRVLEAIDSYRIEDFPYHVLTQGLARSLVVSYCFTPYNTTSGIVMAKRIRQRGEVVDVVYNAMDSVREIDHSTSLITRGYIDRDLRIKTPTAFASWRAIEKFCLEGLATIDNETGGGPRYEKLYSRVTWPASHFLAALYKLRHPSVWWSAEFSDPVSRKIDGEVRDSRVTPGPVIDELRYGLEDNGLPLPDTDNLFEWCEHLAYALADEVVFTNEHQMEYMLGYCPNHDLAKRVREKAVINLHPTLPSKFYKLVNAGYTVPNDVVNLAYFGAFYATRGLDDVLIAMSRLTKDARRRLRLHVFTDKDTDLLQRAKELGVAESVVARGYVPYLEFLNLTTKFDWLIVNDAVTAGTHNCNPYLPSKWSDYRGGGRRVWGLVEDGSPLSAQPLDHTTRVGDIQAAQDFLQKLIASRFPAR